MQFFIDFFDLKNLFPHGYCLSWSPILLWLHVGSDLLISLSYYLIPLGLVYFVRQRRDFPYLWLVAMFAAFIVACGTTHLLSAITIWIPLYWLDGYVKAFTALISVVTVFVVVWVLPKALKLPSPAQLQQEITARQEILDRLHKIASRVPGMVYQFRLSADGKFSMPYCNEGVYEIFRLSPEDVREDATPAFNRVDSDDYGYLMDSIYKSAQELSVWICEFRIRLDEGTVLWLTGNAVPQAEPDGAVLWHGFISDSTRQHNEQEALRQSELKLRTIYNTTSDAFMLLDEQGFIDCNRATLEMFGCATVEEFCSKHPADVSPVQQACGTDSRLLADEKIAFAMENGSCQFEWLHKHLDTGENFHAEVLLCPMVLDDKTIVQAVVRDISERKKMEAELRLAAAVFQAQEGMMVTDENLRILRVNRAFSRITGYGPEDAVGKTPRLLCSGRHGVEFYQQMWEAITRNGSWEGEIWNQRKNGEVYPSYTSITAVKNANEGTHYVATYIDITERKQAEAELLGAKETAIAASQAKSEFLANMSHEIRTPMNAILGFSDILNNLVTDPAQRYYLDAIHRSGKTLLQLINDILDLSKIEAGKLSLQYTAVSLKAVLDDVNIVFSQKAKDKSITLSVLIEAKLPDSLLLDEIRLRQILLNLVGNAFKFTDSGFVKISASGNFNSAGKVDLTIKIADSGIGIPDAQQEKIFAAFTQQDNQGAGYGGTGLGLTICKRLLELMHGTIKVESKLGTGSCFTLSLTDVEVAPSPPKLSALQLQPLESVRFQPARILLADDIRINRDLLRSYLAEFDNLTIIEAETGTQALTLAQQQHFDLILMDRRLPDIEGDSVCRQIKALPGCAEIPIIMVTASVLTTLEQQQPFFYQIQLNKPVNKTELLAAMRTLLPFESCAEMPGVETAETTARASFVTENLAELLMLLGSGYQNRLVELNSSGGLQINAIIDIADELLEIAGQYHCPLLADWASCLKNQAELFDIENLVRSLNSFDELFAQLHNLLNPL